MLFGLIQLHCDILSYEDKTKNSESFRLYFWFIETTAIKKTLCINNLIEE